MGPRGFQGDILDGPPSPPDSPPAVSIAPSEHSEEEASVLDSPLTSKTELDEEETASLKGGPIRHPVFSFSGGMVTFEVCIHVPRRQM